MDAWMKALEGRNEEDDDNVDQNIEIKEAEPELDRYRAQTTKDPTW